MRLVIHSLLLGGLLWHAERVGEGRGEGWGVCAPPDAFLIVGVTMLACSEGGAGLGGGLGRAVRLLICSLLWACNDGGKGLW